MVLQRFGMEILSELDHHLIYIVNYSEYYLDELCDNYRVLDHIVNGWDDVPYRQGEHEFRGHRICISDYDEVGDIPQGAILIILDSYPEARFRWLQEKGDFLDRFARVCFFGGMEMEVDLAYRDKYKDVPLKDMIIFRSGAGASRYIPGSDFGDNARALFEYMLSEGYDEKYELVWFVKNPEFYQNRYAERNVRFLPYDAAITDDITLRDEYYETLCLAKYIFFTNSAVFCRNARKDQVRVQLWHGCGFKSIRHTRIGRDDYKYEYMTVTSELYARLHEDDFGLKSEQLLVTGYPKDDLLYHPLLDWQEMFHIPKASKYIFWLPTWRTTKLGGEWQGQIANDATGLPILESMKMLKQLNALLLKHDIVLIVKLHPWQDRSMLGDIAMSHMVVLENEALAEADTQISEILGHADALISDYSSVAVDYALLDRPTAFTMDDEEEYARNRGFLWDDIRDWLPGSVISSFEDFLAFVDDVALGRDVCREKRHRLNKQFHAFADDRNSARVIAALGI